MTPETPTDLIAQAVDGPLTPEQADALLAAVRVDPSLLELLYQQQTTHRLLQTLGNDPDGQLTAQEVVLRLERERLDALAQQEFMPHVNQRLRQRTWGRRVVALAALAAVIALGFFWNQSRTPGMVKPTPIPLPADFLADGPLSAPRDPVPAMAVVKRTADAVWAAGETRRPGELLPTGWLRLASGTVQLEFLSGAQVILVGPAALRLDDENSAFLESGKASAEVPESAHGFKLKVPGMEVVDLGTAFGVDMSASKGPEVHVFEGEVTLAQDGSSRPPERLLDGKAKRLEAGAFHDIPSRPDAFPTQQILARQADHESGEKQAWWVREINRLAADPDALVVYSFENEQPWSRRVENQVPDAKAESHGTLVGAGWTGGRWQGKHGLEFRGQGDRLRFSVPGAFPAITCLVNIRVDSLANPYNALLMPSRYQNGTFHWTLERGGEMRLAQVRYVSPVGLHHAWVGPVSAPAISEMDFGRWISLATTYDAISGQVHHYRDGEMVGSGTLATAAPILLKDMEFGNWGARRDQPENSWMKLQDKSLDTRNFVGRLDELVILKRALSSEEIAAHCHSGRL